MSSEFYSLTMKNGRTIWVNPEHVEAILEGNDEDTCHVQFASGASVFVDEASETVADILSGLCDDDDDEQNCDSNWQP